MHSSGKIRQVKINDVGKRETIYTQVAFYIGHSKPTDLQQLDIRIINNQIRIARSLLFIFGDAQLELISPKRTV